MSGYLRIAELDVTLRAWCATCRADRPFERPYCIDEHDGDCSEWACVECGEAVMAGFELADPVALGAAARSRPRASARRGVA